MRALSLDDQRTDRAVPWLGIAVLVAAFAVLALLAGRYQALASDLGAWEDRAHRLGRQSGGAGPGARPLSEQAIRAQLQEVTLANQVVRELAVPWNALFNAVDASGGDGIALLSLEPDAQKGSVKISGEARNLDVLLAYVKQLASREVFAGVLLQSHQVQRDVAEKPIRFSLVARWKVAAP